jgi:hypothetical protein
VLNTSLWAWHQSYPILLASLEGLIWIKLKLAGELKPRRLLEQGHRVGTEHRGRVSGSALSSRSTSRTAATHTNFVCEYGKGITYPPDVAGEG